MSRPYQQKNKRGTVQLLQTIPVGSTTDHTGSVSSNMSTDFDELTSLVESLTPEEVLAYRHEVIGPQQIERFPNLFPLNKPHTWIQLPRLRQWLVSRMQLIGPAGPEPMSYIKVEIKEESQTNKENHIIDLTCSSKRKKIKKNEVITILDSKSESEAYPVKKPKHEKNSVCITRKLKVHHVETLTSIPRCWRIPLSASETNSIAYILDLSNSIRKWTDDKGQPIGMDTVIREQDQDNWGGSGSHTTDIEKCPLVQVLGNQRCKRLLLKCQGCYVCNHLDPALLEDCVRYDFDDGQTRRIWEAECRLNMEQGQSPDNILAIFYNYIQQHVCSKDGILCGGAAVIRAYRDTSVSLDGKRYFVGCEKWQRSDPEGMHRFIPIPYNVDEQKIKNLIQEHTEPFLVNVQSQCSLVVPWRIGAKMKQCPYPHTNEGSLVHGCMIIRPCPAQIEVFVPLDKSDHRACVVPRALPHNHPAYQERKLSAEAKEKYTEAVKLYGPMSATVGKVDQAASTRNILGGVSPPKFHPGLTQRGLKERIIKKLKDQQAPQGYDFPGVIARMQDQRKLPKEQQYIHRATDVGGIQMIVTMLPRLAAKLHSVTSSLHDNTYKRTLGEWKEWEVVIWDHRFNMRLTVARIYCNRETADAFEQIWTAYFEVIEELTGESLKIPIFHKEGQLYAFLVNGDAGQAIGLGQYLAKINNPQISGIFEKDPAILVQYVLKTCWTHCAKNLDTLSTCLEDPEDIRYLRSFEHMSTQADIEKWKDWCRSHPRKQIRDWFENKVRHRWYLPFLVQFLSRMPMLHWTMTPRNTNSNESAHAHTNLHTVTRLSLLAAIDKAYEFDRSQEEKIFLGEENCLLPNPRNTFSHRLQYNMARASGRAQAARQHTNDNAKVKELQTLTQQLNTEKESSRMRSLTVKERQESTARCQRLQDQIKALREKGVRLQRGRKPKAILQSNTDNSNWPVSTIASSSMGPPPAPSSSTSYGAHSLSFPFGSTYGTVIDLDPELEPPLASNYPMLNSRVFEHPSTDVFGPILNQGELMDDWLYKNVGF